MNTVWVVIGCAVAGFLIGSLVIDAVRMWRARGQGPAAEGGDNQARKPWFEVLEVQESASIQEIRAAYREKTRQYHPDQVAGLAPEFRATAERKVNEINSAYADAIKAKAF
jgi:DnaJ-domain-containing protein 1